VKSCPCLTTDIIIDSEENKYTRNNLVRVSYSDNGWKQLWQCQKCGTYWEMTWEDSEGGFDTGVTTLKKLEPDQVTEQWAQHNFQTTDSS